MSDHLRRWQEAGLLDAAILRFEASLDAGAPARLAHGRIDRSGQARVGHMAEGPEEWPDHVSGRLSESLRF